MSSVFESTLIKVKIVERRCFARHFYCLRTAANLAGFYMRDTGTKTRTRKYRDVEEESSEMSRAFGRPLLNNARNSSVLSSAVE